MDNKKRYRIIMACLSAGIFEFAGSSQDQTAISPEDINNQDPANLKNKDRKHFLPLKSK